MAPHRVRMEAASRRAMIVDEATQLIHEKGYYNFSVQDLAERCGLTNAGLMHHFGTKEEILACVLRARDERDAAAAGVLTADYTAGRQLPTELSLEQAFDVVRRLVERNVQQAELLRLHAVLRNEALSPEHPAHDFFRDRDSNAIAFYAEIFAASVKDPESFARHVLALIDGLEVQWLRASDEVDLWAEVEQGIESLLNGSEYN